MHYFAYGANMDRAHMTLTAPGATLVGSASISGFRVAIAREGYGTLVPDRGSVVYGMLWQLTPEDEAALDRFEAVDAGVYRKDQLAVQVAGNEVQAMVYLAVDERPGAASPDYVRQLFAAAHAAQFPEPYVRALTLLPQDGSTGTWIPPGHRAGD